MSLSLADLGPIDRSAVKEYKMPKHIMTVDDSRTMRDMVAYTLRAAGYQVTAAEDGQVALSVLQATQIDMIITDFNMPNMNGVVLVRSLRADSNYRTVPILVLTTEIDPELKAECRAAAATGWMAKPFDPVKLIAAVNRLCPQG